MPRRLLLAACALAIVPLFAACGDDDDDGSGAPTGTATQASNATPGTSAVSISTASPTVEGPASLYSVTLDEIGLRWLTDITRTFSFDLMALAKTRDIFSSTETGERLLKDWGYLDGYQASYIPEQRDEGVLLGAYYITLETHRFRSPEGALKAYSYYTGSITAAPVQMSPIGNKAVAYSGTTGKIPGTTKNSEFKQIIFQRGNVVSIVLTTGAQGFMKMEDAWNLASQIDKKILGEKAAIQPTPTGDYKTPTPTPRP